MVDQMSESQIQTKYVVSALCFVGQFRRFVVSEKVFFGWTDPLNVWRSLVLTHVLLPELLPVSTFRCGVSAHHSQSHQVLFIGPIGSQDGDHHGNRATDVEDDVTGRLNFKLDNRELIGWLVPRNKFACVSDVSWCFYLTSFSPCRASSDGDSRAKETMMMSPPTIWNMRGQQASESSTRASITNCIREMKNERIK